MQGACRKLFLTMALTAMPRCSHHIPARDLTEAPASPTFVGNDYRIGELDELAITMSASEVSTAPYPVSTKGTISLPYIGEIAVLGKTASAVRTEIQASIQPYIKLAIVGVTVSARKSLRAYFTGEFLHSGVIAFDGKTTLLQGISMAGGVTPFASGRIIVIRKGENGVLQRYSVKLKDLLDGEKSYDNFIIGRNDTIVAE